MDAWAGGGSKALKRPKVLKQNVATEEPRNSLLGCGALWRLGERRVLLTSCFRHKQKADPAEGVGHRLTGRWITWWMRLVLRSVTERSAEAF